MVGIIMSTGTGRKPDVPRSQVQMAQLDGEIIKHFWADFPERKNRFFSWELELKNFAVDWISTEKMAFFCDWSRSLPDQNDQRWLHPFKGGTVVMHPWRPRGSQSAKKLSSRLFSWPDWLPLGLRGYRWWLCNKGKKKTKQKKNSSSWADTKHRGIHHR